VYEPALTFEECLEAIHQRAATLFGKAGGDLETLSQVRLESDVSVTESQGISVVDLLIKAEMASSKG
jgi:hypothetical protein